MNEQRFGSQVKRVLESGLCLERGIQDRLKKAREAALARQSVNDTSFPYAWGIAFAAPGKRPHFLGSIVLLPALVLVLGVFLGNYLDQAPTAAEIVEFDTAIVMGDLPIDAYLDKGFDAWLKRSLD